MARLGDEGELIRRGNRLAVGLPANGLRLRVRLSEGQTPGRFHEEAGPRTNPGSDFLLFLPCNCNYLFKNYFARGQ